MCWPSGSPRRVGAGKGPTCEGSLVTQAVWNRNKRNGLFPAMVAREGVVSSRSTISDVRT